MSRPLRLAPPTTTLHVYRHLLREASYLPSVVRPFIDDQIRSRFHKCQKDPRHAESRTKKAHSSLRYLRAANGGDISRMNRILLFAFGRIGPRRHDLMAKLVRRPIPRNTEELAAYVKETSEVSSLDRDPDWLDNWDTQKLASLARSQIAASPPNSPRPDITDAMVNLKSIPELNSWGEPWNPKTYRTKLKKFWKNLAHRVLAPLPQKEWQMLSLLAQGCFSEVGWKVPARRTPVGGPYEEGWRWSLYSTQPVARVDRDSSRRFKLLTGARDDNTPTGDPQPLNFQKFTPRLWKRLFMKIWKLSPTVEKVASGQSGSRWEVKWERDNFQPPIAQTAGEMEFFSGIDEEELRPRKVNSGKLRKGKKIV